MDNWSKVNWIYSQIRDFEESIEIDRLEVLDSKNRISDIKVFEEEVNHLLKHNLVANSTLKDCDDPQTFQMIKDLKQEVREQNEILALIKEGTSQIEKENDQLTKEVAKTNRVLQEITDTADLMGKDIEDMLDDQKTVGNSTLDFTDAYAHLKRVNPRRHNISDLIKNGVMEKPDEYLYSFEKAVGLIVNQC